MSRATGIVVTIAMLVISNMAMTFAWYWHLKGGVNETKSGFWPTFLIVLISWGIAFFEYSIMIPANRIGASSGLSVPQLKIIQEVITVCVFIPFAMFFIGEKWRWDYVWAFLCMVGAVYFINRSKL